MGADYARRGHSLRRRYERHRLRQAGAEPNLSRVGTHGTVTLGGARRYASVAITDTWSRPERARYLRSLSASLAVARFRRVTANSSYPHLLQLAVHDASGALLDCALLHPGIEPAEWRTLLPSGPCTATVRGLDDRTATTSFTVHAGRDAQSFVLALPPR